MAIICLTLMPLSNLSLKRISFDRLSLLTSEPFFFVSKDAYVLSDFLLNYYLCTLLNDEVNSSLLFSPMVYIVAQPHEKLLAQKINSILKIFFLIWTLLGLDSLLSYLLL